MSQTRVTHFGGSVEEASLATLDAVLAARYGNEANEYLISNSERYPLLAIQVQGAFACLHFFPGENHPGFVSVGEGAVDELATFYTNTPTEEIQVAADAVVPFEQAKEAAHEFFYSSAIPSCIRWNEL